MSPVAMKLSPRLSMAAISSLSSARTAGAGAGGGTAATGGGTAATGGGATACGGGATGTVATGCGGGAGVGWTIDGASAGLTLAVATTHSSRTTLLSATVSSGSRRSIEISIGPAKFMGGSTAAPESSRVGIRQLPSPTGVPALSRVPEARPRIRMKAPGACSLSWMPRPIGWLTTLRRFSTNKRGNARGAEAWSELDPPNSRLHSDAVVVPSLLLSEDTKLTTTKATTAAI